MPLTELPPRVVLEDRLHRAITAARERLLRLGVDAAVEVTPVAKVTPSTVEEERRQAAEATREMMRP